MALGLCIALREPPSRLQLLGYLIDSCDGLVRFLGSAEADPVRVHGQALVVAHAGQQTQVVLVLSAELPLADELACSDPLLSLAFAHAVENL